MSESDRVRIRHMLGAAREALTFLHGRGKDDLQANRMPALSLIIDVDILGTPSAPLSTP